MKRGYQVTVFDPNPDAVEAVLELGGERGASPKDVAARSEVVITSLPAPSVVEACADVLDTLGSTRFYRGPLGMGVTTKLVNNLVSTSICALVGEAMAIGAAAGLTPEVMLAVMSNTAADNAHLRNAFPNRVLPRDFAPSFKLALAHKDLGLATGLAASLGVPSLIGSAAYGLHTLAIGAGLGDEDQSATIKVLEACTGVPVQSGAP